MKFFKMFTDSAKEMRKLQSIALLGILLACCIAVEPLSIPIPVTTNLKITFSFIFLAVGGYMFGPVSNGLLGAAKNLLCFFIFPSGYAFFAGYILSDFVAGFLYGLFLYKKDVKKGVYIFKKYDIKINTIYIWIILAKLSVTVFVNLGLNTLWDAMMMGKGYFATMTLRITKNAILFPIEVIVIAIVLLAVTQILKSTNIFKFNNKN